MKPFSFIILFLTLSIPSVNARLFTDHLNHAMSDLEEAIIGEQPQKIASSMERLVMLYDRIDELEQADTLCFQLIDINKMIYGEKSPEYGYALCLYAACKIRQRDNKSANRYLELGEPLIKSNVGKNHPLYGIVTQSKAALCFVNNQMQEAIKFYKKTEDIYKSAIALSKEDFFKYRIGYVDAIASKNYACFFAGIPSQNFDSDFALIESLYEDDDEIELSDVLMMKASVELKSRKLFAARYDTERALNILQKNFGKKKIFKSVNVAMQLANILQLLSDYQTADILIDQEIRDINADPRLDQFGILGSLYMMKANGYVHFNINSEEAEYYAVQAMELLSKESYLQTNYLWSKYYHSVALGRNGNLEAAAKEALECLSNISKNVNTVEDLERKYLYWLQYTNVLSQMDSQKAIQTLLKWDESFHRECRQYSEYTQFLSLKLTSHIQRGAVYSKIYSENSTEKNFRVAEQTWINALAIFQEARPYDDSRRLYGDIAKLYILHGDHKKALDYSNKYYDYISQSLLGTMAMFSIKDRERYQKSLSDFSQSIVPYIIGNKTSGKEVNLLLNSSFISKSLLLATEMQISNIIKKTDDPDLKRLYSVYLKAKENTSDSMQLVETAILRHPKVSKYMTNLKTTKWQRIQNALRDDEAAVEFIQTIPMSGDKSDDYIAVIIRCDKDPQLVRLPGISKISFDKDFDLNSLVSIVWKPLEKELNGINQLYFSPTGILHNLPIEYFSGVASRLNIRLTTLAEILKKSDVRSIFSVEAALFGGLEYDAIPDTLPENSKRENSIATQRVVELNERAGVRYLPGSLTEIHSIGETLNTKNIPAKLYTGSKGSEEQFKALSGKKLSVLHFATHGFYYSPDKTASVSRSLRKMFSEDTGLSETDRAMFRTGLLMSGANYKLTGRPLPATWEDGVLTAHEISTTDLYGTSLAVLSACQSGMGDISSEGVFGMPRALKKAGVQTIIMSLWKVDDEATSILMDNFYKSYSEGKSASESLLIAQNALRKDLRFENPYYWSAFVVLDDISRNKYVSRKN